MASRGEISKDTLKEWESETPKGKKLPERKKKKKTEKDARDYGELLRSLQVRRDPDGIEKPAMTASVNHGDNYERGRMRSGMQSLGNNYKARPSTLRRMLSKDKYLRVPAEKIAAAQAFKTGFYRKVAELGMTPTEFHAALEKSAARSMFLNTEMQNFPQLVAMKAQNDANAAALAEAIGGTSKQAFIQPFADVLRGGLQAGGEIARGGMETGLELGKLSLIAAILGPALLGAGTGAAHAYLGRPQAEDIDALQAREQIELYKRLAQQARRRTKMKGAA